MKNKIDFCDVCGEKKEVKECELADESGYQLYCERCGIENKKKEWLLEKAEEKGLFEDIICSNCETCNTIDWREETVKRDGVWYNCEKCGQLDVIGWDIIDVVVKH